MVYITRTELHTDRGWTDNQIADWLGMPDLAATGSDQWQQPPVHLFDFDRVVEAEANEQLKAALSKVMDLRPHRTLIVSVAAKART